MVLAVYLIEQSVQVYMIGTNDYFDQDKTYLRVYIFLLFGLIAALVLFLIYAICKDGRKTRALLPWSFLIAFVTSLLIAFWIIFYI